MLKLVAGIASFALAPIGIGAWMLEKADTTGGMFTIMVGIVFVVFAAWVVIGTPQASAGRTEAAPD